MDGRPKHLLSQCAKNEFFVRHVNIVQYVSVTCASARPPMNAPFKSNVLSFIKADLIRPRGADRPVALDGSHDLVGEPQPAVILQMTDLRPLGTCETRSWSR